MARAGMSRLAFTLALIAALCPRPSHAADPAVVAAAEKEGKLVVYSCDPSETPHYVKDFAALYPKIRVTTYLAGCWQVYNRQVNEHGAGRTIGSVILSVDDVMSQLQSDGLLAPYHSPELTNFPAFAQPDGVNFTYVKLQVLGIVANKDFTAGIPLPTDWTDFANPKPEWKDKIAYFDPRTSSAAMVTLATLTQHFGAAQADAIYQGLRKSGAEVTPTTSAGLAKVLTGERPIMFYLISNHYTEALAKGAPLTFTIPKSGPIALRVAIAPLAGGPSPNAAKLFIDFMLNQEQTIIPQHGEYALRNGIAPPAGMPTLDVDKLMGFDARQAVAHKDELITEWKKNAGF